MISFSSSGSFKNTETFLNRMAKRNLSGVLSKYAQEGVAALRSATPTDSGLVASSWGSIVEVKPGFARITWTNTDIENGFPVAVALQYGYGTGTGGYVSGRDYINPAIKPIFDRIADEVWKEVTSA